MPSCRSESRYAIHCGRWIIIATASICLTANANAKTEPLNEQADAKSAAEWSVMTGYGVTHVGFGATRQKVQTWELNVRRKIKRKDTGRGRLRGSHDFLAEAGLSHLLEPSGRAPIFSINLLACWTLQSFERVYPYLFIGGGPVYTEANIDGMGSKINGNYQAGGGVHVLPRQIRYPVSIEYRFHHISNGGRKKPNDPLNASKFMAGVRIGW